MPGKFSEESASIPAELILLLMIIFIVLFILGGGSIEGVFSIFKSIFAFIFIYILGGLQSILHG